MTTSTLRIAMTGKTGCDWEAIACEMESLGETLKVYSPDTPEALANLFFNTPENMLRYINNHPQWLFTMVYLDTDIQIRRAHFLSKAADDTTKQILADTFEETVDKEEETFADFTRAVAEPLNPDNRRFVPANVTSVQRIQCDFTPQGLIDSATRLISILNAHENVLYLVDLAMKYNLLPVNPHNPKRIQAANIENGITTGQGTISIEQCADLMLSSKDELSELIGRLIGVKNVFVS